MRELSFYSKAREASEDADQIRDDAGDMTDKATGASGEAADVASEVAGDIETFHLPEFCEREPGPSEIAEQEGSEAAGEKDSGTDELPGSVSAEALERPEVATEIALLEEVVRGVNPRYDYFTDNEWSRNCGSCALAGELCLTGYDPETCASAENIATVDDMERATGRKQVELSPEAIQTWAYEQPPGTVTVMGMDYRVGAGHWVNLARTEVGAFVVDAQCDRAWTLERYLNMWGPYVRSWDVGVELGDPMWQGKQAEGDLQ